MKKNLIIFGTRPEAIKMVPVYEEFRKNSHLFETKICVTAQHREMLDQVLQFFKVTPDFDLDIMRPGQNLYTLTGEILEKLKDVIEDFAPDYIYVHGDTTTSMVAALAGFYSGTTVCHVEAGLRTYNKWSPFPEEINRQLTGRLADIHFAPTEQARRNLLNEGVDGRKICVTGNTVIDALFRGMNLLKTHTADKEIEKLKPYIRPDKKIILVTGHRRENHGKGFESICEALERISQIKDVVIIYPVHPNPNVRNIVYERLGNRDNIHLVSPLGYPAFLWLMSMSFIILTDSGGVQEEAPSLGKPVLVMRDTTERPEAVEAGTVILVGTNRDKICQNVADLLSNVKRYTNMSVLANPYGDGKAAERIVDFIKTLGKN